MESTRFFSLSSGDIYAEIYEACTFTCSQNQRKTNKMNSVSVANINKMDNIGKDSVKNCENNNSVLFYHSPEARETSCQAFILCSWCSHMHSPPLNTTDV